MSPEEVWGQDVKECSVCSFSHDAEDEPACLPSLSISAPPLAEPVEVSDFLPISTEDHVEVPCFVPGNGTAIVNRAGTSLYVSGTLSSETGNSVHLSNVLVDTGAAVTLVDSKVINQLGIVSLDAASSVGVSSLVSAGGKPLDLRGTIVIEFALGTICFSAPVLVVSGLTESCLLGADVLHGQSISICLGNKPQLVRGGDCVLLNGFGSPVRRCDSAGDGRLETRPMASGFLLWGGMLLFCMVELLALCSSVFRALRSVHVFRLALVLMFVLIFAYRCSRTSSVFLFPSCVTEKVRPSAKPPDPVPVRLVTGVSVQPWSQVFVHGCVSSHVELLV